MLKNGITRVLALFGFFILFGTAFLVVACQFGSPFRDTILRSDLKLSNEWTEFSTEKKVKLSGDHQFLSVTFDEPFHAVHGENGIRTENGTLFNPEIFLVDENGERYPLTYHSKLGNQRMNYKYDGELPRDKPYVKVMLRSDVPFDAKKIIWTYYYSRDLL